MKNEGAGKMNNDPRQARPDEEFSEMIQQERFSLRHIFLDVDGPVVTFLTKAGELILLGVIWLITSLPVFTMGTATTALYHAVVKSVRHERGYPVREYFKAFKKHFKKGTIITLIMLAWTAGLYFFNRESAHIEVSLQTMSAKLLVILVILTLSIAVYLFPILSRFRVSVGQAFNMAFIISGQHFVVTLIHVAAMGGLVYLVIYILPLLTLLFLPSFWLFFSSFLMERVLKSYMPEPTEETGDEWYYE